ncbi:MAG: class E sortase [Rubrobacteraceae bacterium]
MAALVVVLGACGSLAGDQSPREAPDGRVAPQQGERKPQPSDPGAPEDETLTLTAPEMERVRNVEVPTGLGNDEELLRENHAVHLLHTGFPWEEEANVYIAGHRLGYEGTDSYLAFYDIDRMQNGDEIFVTDAEGKEYTYRVFETITVEPTELQVLDPMKGKNIISLQACTLPDYSDRIIVRGELVEG